MHDTRQQSIQHLRMFGCRFSTSARLDGCAKVELIGEDEMFECFGVRMGGKVIVEERDVGAIIPSIIVRGYEHNP